MAIKKQQETEEEKAARALVEGIAENIIKLASTVRGLINGKMKMHGLVILLASSSKLSQVQVEKVLKALATMDEEYLRK